MKNVNLKPDERREIALKLVDWIEAGKSAKGNLSERWQRAEDLYYVVPGAIRMELAGNAEAMTYGLWRQKADRIASSSVAGIAGMRPYAQILKDGESLPDFEDACHEVARKAGFEKTMRTAVIQALNTNAGVRRLRPVQTENGLKMEFENIHPRNMVVYPLHVASMDEAICIGHRVPITIHTIKERSKSGRYYKDLPDMVPDNVRDIWDSEYAKSKGDLTNPDSLTEPDEGAVEVYECIIRWKGKKYLAQVSVTMTLLLSLVPYIYPRCWYVFWRTEEEDNKVFPSCSVAQTVQAACITFAEAYNLMRVGSQYSAFPVVVVTGGQLATKAKSYGPGQVWEFTESVKVEMLRTQFDPSALPLVSEKMEEQVDALTGINRLGTGQNLPVNTKATAIDALMDQMKQSQDAFTWAFSDSVEQEYGLLLMYMEWHWPELTQSYPELQRVEVPPGSVSIETTGRSTGGGDMLRTKIRAAMELAMTPGCKYDPAKIADRAVQALDLPFDVSGLERDGLSEATNALIEAQEQLGIAPEQVVEAGLQIATQSIPGVGGGLPQDGGMAPPEGLDASQVGGGAENFGG